MSNPSEPPAWRRLELRRPWLVRRTWACAQRDQGCHRRMGLRGGWASCLRNLGEWEYDKSEQVIRELLRENGATGLNESTTRQSADGAEAPPSDDVRSPETYVGYARAEHFASPERVAQDSPKIYSLPARPSLNQWGFGGAWNVGAESAVLQEAGGKIAFRFHSRDLHMVLAPPKGGKPVRFKVRLDGAAPGDDHGVDSNADGAGEIRQPRMYQLLRQKGP